MPNIQGIIKSIRNIMRQDTGLNGDAQRIEHGVLVVQTRRELTGARGELDDAVGLRVREPLHGRVQRDDGRDVDGGICVCALLGGIEHLAELSGGRDRHGVPRGRIDWLWRADP